MGLAFKLCSSTPCWRILHFRVANLSNYLLATSSSLLCSSTLLAQCALWSHSVRFFLLTRLLLMVSFLHSNLSCSCLSFCSWLCIVEFSVADCFTSCLLFCLSIWTQWHMHILGRIGQECSHTYCHVLICPYPMAQVVYSGAYTEAHTQGPKLAWKRLNTDIPKVREVHKEC